MFALRALPIIFALSFNILHVNFLNTLKINIKDKILSIPYIFILIILIFVKNYPLLFNITPQISARIEK